MTASLFIVASSETCLIVKDTAQKLFGECRFEKHAGVYVFFNEEEFLQITDMEWFEYRSFLLDIDGIDKVRMIDRLFSMPAVLAIETRNIGSINKIITHIDDSLQFFIDNDHGLIATNSEMRSLIKRNINWLYMRPLESR